MGNKPNIMSCFKGRFQQGEGVIITTHTSEASVFQAMFP